MKTFEERMREAGVFEARVTWRDRYLAAERASAEADAINTDAQGEVFRACRAAARATGDEKEAALTAARAAHDKANAAEQARASAMARARDLLVEGRNFGLIN